MSGKQEKSLGKEKANVEEDMRVIIKEYHHLEELGLDC